MNGKENEIAKKCKTEYRSLRYRKENISFLLERKKVKNLNLRIKEDLTITVSAGEGVSLREIEGFLKRKWEFILDALASFRIKKEEREKRKEDLADEFFYLGEKLSLKAEEGKFLEVSLEDGELRLLVKDPNNREEVRGLLKIWLKKQAEGCFRY